MVLLNFLTTHVWMLVQRDIIIINHNVNLVLTTVIPVQMVYRVPCAQVITIYINQPALLIVLLVLLLLHHLILAIYAQTIVKLVNQQLLIV